ncbi:hypothetical protein GCM10023224_14040 [Streptomonospora halophila]|uniref:NIPSNAP domain-containing protein n=1 Tax=Streptomonospora halophila TaxID=427369 RepID=A0ABP9G9U6_9ACTN
MAATVQLRTYTVREGLLDEWVQRWREEIVPLRLRFGFTLGHAWIDRERNQFIWTISYEGEQSFEERNREYWNCPERAAMSLDPKDYLEATDKQEVARVY